MNAMCEVMDSERQSWVSDKARLERVLDIAKAALLESQQVTVNETSNATAPNIYVRINSHHKHTHTHTNTQSLYQELSNAIQARDSCVCELDEARLEVVKLQKEVMDVTNTNETYAKRAEELDREREQVFFAVFLRETPYVTHTHI